MSIGKKVLTGETCALLRRNPISRLFHLGDSTEYRFELESSRFCEQIDKTLCEALILQWKLEFQEQATPVLQ